MDKFYIITNEEKDPNMETTNFIQKYLIDRDKVCYIQKNNIKENGISSTYTNADEIPEDVECVIVLGGDGTMIRAARDTILRNIPLLGVNLGTLGYLAEIDKPALEPALDKLINNEYVIEERMMIQGIVYHTNQVLMDNLALNDIVISRSAPLRVINFNLYVNGQYLSTYSADGIIISTPTGSTGYNLSAGGPLVTPDASLILITPICSHTLSSRSIVLSADDHVEIEIGMGRKLLPEESVATFDGGQSAYLSCGDRVEVKRSPMKTKIVKISDVSFLETLRKKMNEN